MVFEDRQLLTKSQRIEGLKRSWILLNPQLVDTISDLSAYLLRVFDLDEACPDGLVLSVTFLVHLFSTLHCLMIEIGCKL